MKKPLQQVVIVASFALLLTTITHSLAGNMRASAFGQSQSMLPDLGAQIQVFLKDGTFKDDAQNQVREAGSINGTVRAMDDQWIVLDIDVPVFHPSQPEAASSPNNVRSRMWIPCSEVRFFIQNDV